LLHILIDNTPLQAMYSSDNLQQVNKGKAEEMQHPKFESSKPSFKLSYRPHPFRSLTSFPGKT